MIDSKRFTQALLGGRIQQIKQLIQEHLRLGHKADAILNEGLIRAMDQVGIEFKNDEIFLPEVLLAARAMHEGMAILKPILSTPGATEPTTIVLGTVKGDLHDIGKNLVGMMLEGAGFEVINIGVDVPSEKFIEATERHNAKIIALSALLTTTMMEMESVIQRLKATQLSRSVKTIVGGAPLTERFASTIGADAYAPDAASAVTRIRELLLEKSP